MIRVKATRRGYYGTLREVGEQFTVADKKHVGSWMEPLGPVKEEKAKGSGNRGQKPAGNDEGNPGEGAGGKPEDGEGGKQDEQTGNADG